VMVERERDERDMLAPERHWLGDGREVGVHEG
jgi:hypothetical protein